MVDLSFNSLEICAGAGGQALGLERAGFEPVLLIDNDPDACSTLFANRPRWKVLQTDLKDFVGAEHEGVLDVDLLSAGVPSTPYSVAGHQRGIHDDRDLVRASIFLTMEIKPRVLMIENTPALLTAPKFAETRSFVEQELQHLGYQMNWRILDAQHFGVPQTRRSSVLVAMRPSDFARFEWPTPHGAAPTVGEALRDSMASRGWAGADEWAKIANRVAPTIVGGSKNHGGADLGPSRTKLAWAELGVNGGSLDNDVPGPDFVMQPERGRQGLPKLTIPQVARVQGFSDDWIFTGKKTPKYKQVAQAFPPPVAAAVGRQIAHALSG